MQTTSAADIEAVLDESGPDYEEFSFEPATGGRAPTVFGAVVTVAVNYYNYEIRGVTVDQDISTEGAAGAFQQFQPPAEALLTNTALGIVFSLWAAYIWVYGLQSARGLSKKGAIYTVAVPVAVSVLFSIQTLTPAL